ncbi:MAG: hypothetical protein V3V92_02895 [Candidatus Hydrothermarchaeales archaeon]
MPRFLERILGARKKEISGGVVTLKELRKWCEDEIEGHEKKAMGELESKVKKIVGLRREAGEIIEELEEYKVPKEIKKRIYKPALTHQPTYVRGMREALSSLNQPEMSMGGLERFHSNLTNTMKAVQKIQFGQGRYLVLAFKEQMMGIGGVLNRIIDLKERYGEILKELESDTQGIRKVLKGIDAVEEGLKNRKHLAGEITDMKNSLEGFDDRYAGLNAELKKFISSANYKRFIKTKKAMEQRRLKGGEVESQVLNLLRPKARVFRKYKKFLESKGEKDPFIEEYLNDPLSTFLNEEAGFSRLKRIISGIERAGRDGGLSLSDKELRATQIEWKVLDRLKEVALKSIITEELDDAPEKERERLNQELQKTVDENERLTRSIAEAKEKMKQIKKSIAEEKTKLEENVVSIREGDYSIELPSS